MHAFTRNIAQRAIDHALALKPRNTGKRRAFDLDRKMRFAAAVIAGMAVMFGAVIGHFQPGWREGVGKNLPDFLFDGSTHGFHLGHLLAMLKRVSTARLHGRYESRGRLCSWPECEEAGEFRAPGVNPSGFDGPGDYRWFCLEHIRQFNAGYDYFDGMDPEEILRAQSPIHGWESESRTFNAAAGIDGVPRWSDFTDPLEAISARAHGIRSRAGRANHPGLRKDGHRVSHEERRALDVMGLPIDADRRALRERYAKLVRENHPDHNGGNRKTEARLQQVVAAYQLLRKAAAFS